MAIGIIAGLVAAGGWIANAVLQVGESSISVFNAIMNSVPIKLKPLFFGIIVTGTVSIAELTFSSIFSSRLTFFGIPLFESTLALVFLGLMVTYLPMIYQWYQYWFR